jgi:hypothetical protein
VRSIIVKILTSIWEVIKVAWEIGILPVLLIVTVSLSLSIPVAIHLNNKEKAQQDAQIQTIRGVYPKAIEISCAYSSSFGFEKLYRCMFEDSNLLRSVKLIEKDSSFRVLPSGLDTPNLK